MFGDCSKKFNYCVSVGFGSASRKKSLLFGPVVQSGVFFFKKSGAFAEKF